MRMSAEKMVALGLLDHSDEHEDGSDADDYTSHEFTVTETEYGKLRLWTAHTAVGWYKPLDRLFDTMDAVDAFLETHWDTVIHGEIELSYDDNEGE